MHTIIIPTLQLRKQKHRELKYLLGPRSRKKEVAQLGFECRPSSSFSHRYHGYVLYLGSAAENKASRMKYQGGFCTLYKITAEFQVLKL